MSNAIVEAKTSGLALKNDALRAAFARDGVRCLLLKREGQTKRFTQIVELTRGWRIKFDDNRNESGLFRYASTDLDFRDDWAAAHAVAYGVPDESGEVEIFSFAEGEKDSIDPDGSSVYWSCRVVKLVNQRFVAGEPAEPEPDQDLTWEEVEW